MQDNSTRESMHADRMKLCAAIARAYDVVTATMPKALDNWRQRPAPPRRRHMTAEKKSQMLRAYFVAYCQHDDPLRSAEFAGVRRPTLRRWLDEIDATRKRWQDFDDAIVEISISIAVNVPAANALRAVYSAAPSITYIVTAHKYEHHATHAIASRTRDSLQREHPEKKFRIMKVLNVEGDGQAALQQLQEGA